LLEDYPKNKYRLDAFREKAMKFRELSFEEGNLKVKINKTKIFEEWKNNVLPVVKSIRQGEKKWIKKDFSLFFKSFLIFLLFVFGRMILSLNCVKNLLR